MRLSIWYTFGFIDPVYTQFWGVLSPFTFIWVFEYAKLLHSWKSSVFKSKFEVLLPPLFLQSPWVTMFISFWLILPMFYFEKNISKYIYSLPRLTYTKIVYHIYTFLLFTLKYVGHSILQFREIFLLLSYICIVLHCVVTIVYSTSLLWMMFHICGSKISGSRTNA